MLPIFSIKSTLNLLIALEWVSFFPSKKGERKLIGFSLVLPMGWAESSQVFCAVTEMVANLANTSVTTNIQWLDVTHWLDAISETVHVYVCRLSKQK